MNDDADFDEPAPRAPRPGKATHAAPDPEKAKPVGAKSAQTEKPAASTAIEGENMLAVLGDMKPIDVLQSEDKRKALYAEIRKAIAGQTVDLSTQAGRDRVKSFAFKITRTRTALDAAGKKATADKREAINAINALRNDAIAALQALEAEARKPLTEWEAVEAEKAAERGRILQDIAKAISWASRETPPALAGELAEILEMVEAVTIEAELWGDDEAMAESRKAEAITLLRSRIEAAELRERLALAEAEAATLRAGGSADPDPATARPVHEQQDLPPRMDDEAAARVAAKAGVDLGGNPLPRNGPPAAESPPAELSPVQKARRLCLPVLGELGIHGDQAKGLILAIEAGEIPGIVATYLEK